MAKNVKLTKDELLHACWGQFDGLKTGVTKKGGMRLRETQRRPSRRQRARGGGDDAHGVGPRAGISSR